MKEKVVLFDIDYTVINSDSMMDFLLYALKTKTLKTIIVLPKILYTLLMYLFKLKTLKQAKEAVFLPITFYRENELEVFFTECIEGKINTIMLDRINSLKNENYKIIMVTASPEAYMNYFKQYGYADFILGTKLEHNGEKYLNRIIGKNCKGKEKVNRINELLNGLSIEIDFNKSYAYSDSKSDLPMLSLVKNAYLVNKKNGQLKEAIQNKNTSKVYI